MILADLDIAAYHAAPHVSASKLSTYLELGPRAYWARYVRNEHAGPPQSEAQRVGQAFEDLVQLGVFPAFMPEDMTLRTKAGKAWKDAREAEGLAVLPNSYSTFFEWGLAAFQDNATARSLADASAVQVTLRWDYGPGLPCQSRPDWLCVEGCLESAFRPCAPDLKTTTSLRAFERSILQYGYHRQAAFVRLALEAEGYADTAHPLIAVEKAFPHRCQVFWLDEDFLALGLREVSAGLDRLAEHYESGEWPRVTEDERTVSPPAWAMPDDEWEAA